LSVPFDGFLKSETIRETFTERRADDLCPTAIHSRKSGPSNAMKAKSNLSRKRSIPLSERAGTFGQTEVQMQRIMVKMQEVIISKVPRSLGEAVQPRESDILEGIVLFIFVVYRRSHEML